MQFVRYTEQSLLSGYRVPMIRVDFDVVLGTLPAIVCYPVRSTSGITTAGQGVGNVEKTQLQGPFVDVEKGSERERALL